MLKISMIPKLDFKSTDIPHGFRLEFWRQTIRFITLRTILKQKTAKKILILSNFDAPHYFQWITKQSPVRRGYQRIPSNRMRIHFCTGVKRQRHSFQEPELQTN